MPNWIERKAYELTLAARVKLGSLPADDADFHRLYGYHLCPNDSSIATLPVLRTDTFTIGLLEPITVTFHDLGLFKTRPGKRAILAIVRNRRGEWLRTPLKMDVSTSGITDSVLKSYLADVVSQNASLRHAWEKRRDYGQAQLKEPQFGEILLGAVGTTLGENAEDSPGREEKRDAVQVATPDLEEALLAYGRVTSRAIASAEAFGGVGVKLRRTGWPDIFIGDQLATLLADAQTSSAVSDEERAAFGASPFAVYYPGDDAPDPNGDALPVFLAGCERVKAEGSAGQLIRRLPPGWYRDARGISFFYPTVLHARDGEDSRRLWAVSIDEDGFVVCLFTGPAAAAAASSALSGGDLFAEGRGASTLADPTGQSERLAFQAEWPAMSVVANFAIPRFGLSSRVVDLTW